MTFALDVTALSLSTGAALCAWRSCRWLAQQARGAALRDAAAFVATVARDADPDRSTSAAPPLVSLLVPARDEERNVEACLRGLLAQRGVRCEVLLLDDGSRDATVALAERTIEGFREGVDRADSDVSGARVLHGRPLPDGWGGKCHACHQLAEAARGDWLLFLDADTRLAAGAVASALAAARRADVELASFLPRYVGDQWPNRLVVPWLYFFLTALVPLPEVTSSRHARLAVANGQAILVRRDAYERAGGHAAIRDHIVEDVSLAIAAKRAGLRIALLDGHRWLTCAMYDGGRALVAGFAKSFHSAARRYPLQWAALLTLLVLIGCWPWLRLLTATEQASRVLSALTILVVGGTFGALLLRFRQRLAALLVWPVALWGLLAIAVAGGVSGLLGRELAWRGRPVGGRAPS